MLVFLGFTKSVNATTIRTSFLLCTLISTTRGTFILITRLNTEKYTITTIFTPTSQGFIIFVFPS